MGRVWAGYGCGDRVWAAWFRCNRVWAGYGPGMAGVIGYGPGIIGMVTGYGSGLAVAGDGPGTAVAGCGPGTAVAGDGPGTAVAGCGPGTAVAGCGPGTAVAGCVPGTAVAGCGPGTAVAGCGPGIAVTGVGVIRTSTNIETNLSFLFSVIAGYPTRPTKLVTACANPRHNFPLLLQGTLSVTRALRAKFPPWRRPASSGPPPGLTNRLRQRAQSREKSICTFQASNFYKLDCTREITNRELAARVLPSAGSVFKNVQRPRRRRSHRRRPASSAPACFSSSSAALLAGRRPQVQRAPDLDRSRRHDVVFGLVPRRR